MELLVPEQHKSEDDNGKHDAKHNCVCAHQGRVHSQVLLKKIAKAILVKKFYRIVFRGGGRVRIRPPCLRSMENIFLIIFHGGIFMEAAFEFEKYPSKNIHHSIL